jgi:hypothetical protein
VSDRVCAKAWEADLGCDIRVSLAMRVSDDRRQHEPPFGHE